MKKLFAIAFTCVYLTLAVGVVRTTHYCMGRVKSSSLFSFETTKCPCALLAKSFGNTCCNDEHSLIKIDDDYSASWIVSVTPDYFEIGPSFNVIGLSEPETNFSLTEAFESPPPCDTPLFRKYCSLVFYDEEYTA